MSALKHLVRTALELHGIDRPEPRLDEIAIETRRLLSGLAEVPMRPDPYDEPSNHAALLRREADRG